MTTPPDPLTLIAPSKAATPPAHARRPGCRPPGLPVGGIQGILPGESQRATLNLEAGSYVLICYIPNAQGAPHFALGMAQPLEVTE